MFIILNSYYRNYYLVILYINSINNIANMNKIHLLIVDVLHLSKPGNKKHKQLECFGFFEQHFCVPGSVTHTSHSDALGV